MVNQALEKLSKMAIFKMSLGSKELFHSNFLEFLWEINNISFIKLINQLYGEDILSSDKGVGYYMLGREKNHFDICIFHQEWKKKKNGEDYKNATIVYDVILENKVKSIPDKDQLVGYNQKSQTNTKYILLSLMENFENKDDINNNGWKIVSYDNLSKAIKCYYNDTNSYISDYCELISTLHCLQKDIVPEDFYFLQQTLYPAYREYNMYRLHDLYIKCRGLKFIELLKKKLVEKKISYEFVKESGESLRKKFREEQNQALDVYLNWNVFNAEGQIAAFIHKGGKEIYEIVIQGSQSLQYRHGINYIIERDGKYNSLDKDKKNSQSLIWDKVKSCEFMQGFKYPDKNKEHCGYDTDYIYRYNKVAEKEYGENIESLLNHMVDDIEYFVKKFKCK